MNWLRLYTDILDDEKIAKLTDNQYRIFTYLMLVACEKEQNGSFTFDISAISWRLRMQPKQIKKAIDVLRDLNIISIENNILCFVNWGKRQYKSDDINARVKRFRGKNETLQPTLENRNRTETETEQIEKPDIKTVDNSKIIEDPKPEKNASLKKPKEQFETETEKQELQSLVNQIVVKYPRLPIYKFIQLHNRDHPQAMLETLRQFLNAKIEVPEAPIMMKWLDISITEKNKTYNARDSEAQNNELKADKNPLAAMIAKFCKPMPSIQG
jgi:hypothetical protein